MKTNFLTKLFLTTFLIFLINANAQIAVATSQLITPIHTSITAEDASAAAKAANTAVAAARSITFATEATYPPFEAIKPSGEIYGFDIDVAKALCQEMKVHCNFTNQPFESLIIGLKLGKFDAVIAAMGVTVERKRVVDFTLPYYVNSAAFVATESIAKQVKKSNTVSNSVVPEEVLKQKTIGVQGGTTFAAYLQKKYSDSAKIKTYASIEGAFLDLEAGRIGAVFADLPIIIQWLKHANSKDQYALVGKPIKDAEFFGQGNSIAVNKNNPQLLQQLNVALSTLKANGELRKIANQYFGDE
jgi:arginine transport system substrate-binding protein